MKQKDKLYEEWLNELKSKQPELSNPEELTAAIMDEVNRQTEALRKKRLRLFALARISGIAATLLLCIFISDVYFVPDTRQATYTNRRDIPSVFSSDKWQKMSLLEKSIYLSGRYTQRQRQQQARISVITNFNNSEQ